MMRINIFVYIILLTFIPQGISDWEHFLKLKAIQMMKRDMYFTGLYLIASYLCPFGSSRKVFSETKSQKSSQ